MDELISGFSQQLSEALKVGFSTKISKPAKTIENVVIAGMGGSAIGGTIVQDYTKPRLAIPLIINSSYELPEFVSQNSMVIICSYSGNTEEVINNFKQAIDKQAFVVCSSSGGEILTLSQEKGCPFLTIPGGLPPRASLGYSIVNILFALHLSGLMDNGFVKEVEASANLLLDRQDNFKAIAADLAKKIEGKLPVIYASEQMHGVSVRWRQQINENSKLVGWDNVLPEMNHNELVGWRDRNESLAVLFLISAFDHPRVKRRMVLSKEIIERCTPYVFEVSIAGNSYWEEAFSLIHIGDWLSFYLAKARGVDAEEVKVIDYLKSKLSEKHA